MEDIMHIQSAFLRNVISQAAVKAIRKQGYKSVDVELNDIFAKYSEDHKKIRVHLDIDTVVSREQNEEYPYCLMLPHPVSFND